MAERTAELHDTNLRLREEIAERKQIETMLREREQRYRDIFDNTSDGVVLMEVTGDLRFRLISINPTFERLAGIASSEAAGKYIEDYLSEEPAQKLRAIYRRCVELGVSIDYESAYNWPSGYRADHATAIPIHDDRQRIYRIAVISRDVTERKALERVLRKREAEMRTLIENSPDCIVRYGPDARIMYRNPATEKIVGIPNETALGKRIDEIHPDGQGMQLLVERVLATGEPGELEIPLGPADAPRHHHMRVVPEASSDGKITSVLALGRDVTRQKQLEEEVRRHESEFRQLVEHSPDMIARYDREYRCIYANPALLAAANGDAGQILGKTPTQWPSGKSGRIFRKTLRHVLQKSEARDVELHWGSGESGAAARCSHLRMTPELDRSGEVTHVLVVGRDITEIDQYRKEIHRQAFFDALTGLPNRLLLSDRIAQTIAEARHHGKQFGLMMLDLDHFKDVNDTLGHGVGDRLLHDAAERMQACVRTYDTVARLGGDEFAILLPDVRKRDDLAVIAGKILQQLAEPFMIDGQELFVSGSIGISHFPEDSDEPDALYKYADSAMYQAKKLGRNNYQFYAAEFTRRSLERMETDIALRKAQKQGELELYYQPQVSLKSGKLTGAEALLRWRRPGHGLVGPDMFIPHAEETGLILEMGEWVLATACRAAAAWNRGRNDPFKVSVNLSTRQFVRNDISAVVSRILAETGCKPAWLELEITENLLLEDSKEVIDALAAFHAMGVTVSIDDFGTGYSALSYLHRFPITRLKIDRSFVCGIGEQRDKQELVKIMLSIASALGIRAVAEGVETPRQASFVAAHGCDTGQGYLFGKPMPASELESMLAGNRWN